MTVFNPEAAIPEPMITICESGTRGSTVRIAPSQDVLSKMRWIGVLVKRNDPHGPQFLTMYSVVEGEEETREQFAELAT